MFCSLCLKTYYCFFKGNEWQLILFGIQKLAFNLFYYLSISQPASNLGSPLSTKQYQTFLPNFICQNFTNEIEFRSNETFQSMQFED